MSNNNKNARPLKRLRTFKAHQPRLTNRLSQVQVRAQDSYVSDNEFSTAIDPAVVKHLKNTDGIFVSDPMPVKDSNKDSVWVTVGGVGEEMTYRLIHKEFRKSLERAGLGHIPIKSIIVRGGGVVNIEFRSPDDAKEAAKVDINFGTVLLVGQSLQWYYRVILSADELKAEDEEDVFSAIANQLGIEPTSININEEKHCVSVYVRGLPEFATFLSEYRAEVIEVKGEDEDAKYYLHVQRNSSGTNDPDMYKLAMSNAPNMGDLELREALVEIFKGIIPAQFIVSASVYHYPDTNKPARFGFLWVKERMRQKSWRK